MVWSLQKSRTSLPGLWLAVSCEVKSVEGSEEWQVNRRHWDGHRGGILRTETGELSIGEDRPVWSPMARLLIHDWSVKVSPGQARKAPESQRKKKIGHGTCKSGVLYVNFLCVRESPICLKIPRTAVGGPKGGLQSSGYWPYRDRTWRKRTIRRSGLWHSPTSFRWECSPNLLGGWYSARWRKETKMECSVIWGCIFGGLFDILKLTYETGTNSKATGGNTLIVAFAFNLFNSYHLTCNLFFCFMINEGERRRFWCSA